jgi:transcriptional regulator with XRE-family HTH domain
MEGMENMTAKELQALIAENVRDRREELGMTQADLAEAMGVDQPRIAEIESGSKSFRVPRLAELGEALQTTVAALVTKAKSRSKVPA